MKWAFKGFELGIFFQQIKQQGFSLAVQAAIWRLKMVLAKTSIQLQDRFGWYRYQDWIRENEAARQVSIPGNLQPRFSLFILCQASSPSLLKDTLDSLLIQTYFHWEALVYIDYPETYNSLKSGYSSDPRIHWRSTSKASLQIILDQELSGNWLGFLISGDILAEECLANLVSGIEAHQGATMMYSDTDRLSMDGKIRHSPSFWPDWSPELLLSVNYLRRAYISRDSFVNSAGNAPDFEDTLLRCTESAPQIVHIPRVLCHIRDSQAASWFGEYFQNKNLFSHLERSGRHGIQVNTSTVTSAVQVTWASAQPLVSIIILTHDQVALLKRCIESIISKTTYPQFEIILVENNSQYPETFDYYQRLKSEPRVKLLVHDQAFNYSAFNNWGAQSAQGDLLLFLNNDMECIHPDWLDEMARWACQPEIGVVGAKLLYPNHTIQHAGLVIGLEGHANHVFAGCREGYAGLFGSTEWYRDYSAVTGAAMMLRKTVFEQIGGFDEAYSLAFNDIELCLRSSQAGYRVVYTPFARLIHHEGATRSTYKPASDIKLASQHLRSLIEQGDPFYNPNLSAMRRVPTFRRRGETSALQRLDQLTRYLG
jgi:GT2 family glycosyltransferase